MINSRNLALYIRWGPNGDPKTEKGPHGDPGPQMGTHLGAVQLAWRHSHVVLSLVLPLGSWYFLTFILFNLVESELNAKLETAP